MDALLGQEPLEQQFHPDGIDGGDPQRVTEGGIRGGATSLNQDAARSGELNDVPDHQEISRQAQLADDGELARDLGARAVVQRAVAIGGAAPGDRLQITLLRSAVGDGVGGEGVAEIGERERAAVGDRARGAHGGGEIAKQRGHFGGGFQVMLGAGRQAAPDLVDRDAEARAGEDVVNAAAIGRGVTNVVGRDDGDVQRGGLRDHDARAVGLGRVEMALHLQVQVVGGKRALKRRKIVARGCSRKRDQSGRVLGQQRVRRVAGAFGAIGVNAGEEAAQVLVSGAVFDQQEDGRRTAVVQRHLRADQRPQARATGGPKNRGAPGTPFTSASASAS